MKKIYKKLSYLYIKKNKSRTLMTFIMIVSSVAFMFSIDMIKVSQEYNKKEAYKKVYGDYHVEYVDISKEKLKKVENDSRIGYRDNVQNLGYLINKNNGTKSELKSFNGYKDNSKEYFFRKAQVLEGREPKNNTEIVLDEISAKNFGILKNPIGKTISFELRKEYKLPNGEKSLYSENKKFKVVGLVKRKYKNIDDIKFDTDKNRGISYTYGNFEDEGIIPIDAVTYDIILRFKGDELLVSNLIESVALKYNLGRMSFSPNSNYISVLTEISYLKKILEINQNNLILIITVILLVFNMLNIIWNEYLKEISMLRLIGARKKDVKSMVVYHSIMLSVFGTLVGIILGLCITKLGLIIFKDDFIKSTGISPKMHIDVNVVVKTIVITIGAIILATIIPVLKIGKVQCIEAISDNKKYLNRGKQSKIGKFLQNKIGIYRYMGIRNLWIKKTRTIVSIFTITLCGYLIMYTFSDMQNEVDNKISKMYHKYDIETSLGITNDSETFKIPKENVKKIENMEGVESINPTFNSNITFIEDKNNINNYFLEYYGIHAENKVEYESYLRFYENDKIKKIVEQYMLNNKNAKDIEGKTNGNINVAVFNNFYDPMKTHTYHKIYKNLKVGDVITIGVNYHNGNKIEKRYEKVRIAAIISEDWQGYGDYLMPFKMEIITSSNNMKEMLGFKAYNNLGVDYKDINNVEKNKEIEKYIKENIQGTTKFKRVFTREQVDSRENVFRESFINIVLVLMIAAISIFCTVKSNLMERRKEIFTMRALGMSIKDMNSMNMWESVTYAVLSIVSGIGLATYKLFKFVEWNNNAYINFGIEHFMDFTFPYPQAIIFAVVTLVTCIIAVKLANREFKNKEISDGMRDID